MKLSRRKLAQSLAAAAATATLTGQAQQAQQQAPPAAPSPDALLQAARAQLGSTAQAVARVDLPMSTEPATRFETRT